MFDLNALPDHYLGKYGREKVAEVVGQKTAIVEMWNKRSKFPLDAVARLLDFDPSPLGAITPLYGPPTIGEKMAFLVPLSGPPSPFMMDCLVRLFDPTQMWYDRFAFNCLSVSRNVLAARFLRSASNWSYWQDGDTAVPCGDAEWYKKSFNLPQMPDIFAGLHTVWRLLSHRQEKGIKDATIVSGCYVGRKRGGAPQFHGGESAAVRAEIRRGPRDILKPVLWSGFGSMLVHRSVFEDIIRTQGDQIRMKPGGLGTHFNYEYGFFDPIDRETPGDDIPLANRALKAGHKCYVDLAVQAAHVGERAYTYQDV
jgi:hypothetical protein